MNPLPRPTEDIPNADLAAPASRKTRLRGTVLVVLGVFLALYGAAILVLLAPQLMQPGVVVDGSDFIRTPSQAVAMTIALSCVTMIGLGCVAGGIQLRRQGKLSKPVLFVLVALFVATVVMVQVLNAALR